MYMHMWLHAHVHVHVHDMWLHRVAMSPSIRGFIGSGWSLRSMYSESASSSCRISYLIIIKSSVIIIKAESASSPCRISYLSDECPPSEVDLAEITSQPASSTHGVEESASLMTNHQ